MPKKVSRENSTIFLTNESKTCGVGGNSFYCQKPDILRIMDFHAYAVSGLSGQNSLFKTQFFNQEERKWPENPEKKRSACLQGR
jgi:hypothetical protein